MSIIVTPARYSPQMSKLRLGLVNAPAQPAVRPVPIPNMAPTGMIQPEPFNNPIQSWLDNREAVIECISIRTHGVKDLDHDNNINPFLGEAGTFPKASAMIKEDKAHHVNAYHVLPTTTVSKKEPLGVHQKDKITLQAQWNQSQRQGQPFTPQTKEIIVPPAGSQYAPAALDLSEEYRTPGSGLSVEQECINWLNDVHREGMCAGFDLPSAGGLQMAEEHPEYMAWDTEWNSETGKYEKQMLTPKDWVDIRRLNGHSPVVRRVIRNYLRYMFGLGFDFVRIDVSRDKPDEFWKEIWPEFERQGKGRIDETYIQEDASPINNLPADRPERLYKTGARTTYYQWHNNHQWNGPQFIYHHQRLQEMLNRVGLEKSTIGSFVTHDDPSAMAHGGVTYCKNITGLMLTQPNTNPYLLDGFLTGYEGYFDIYNWTDRPEGKHPEIGAFWDKLMKIRTTEPFSSVLRIGQTDWLPVKTSPVDPQIVAYTRRHNGKTLLAIANKDMNAVQEGTIELPKNLVLGKNLYPLAESVGRMSDQEGTPAQALTQHRSHFSKKTDENTVKSLKVKLMPGAFHLFEIANTPTRAGIPQRLPAGFSRPQQYTLPQSPTLTRRPTPTRTPAPPPRQPVLA